MKKHEPEQNQEQHIEHKEKYQSSENHEQYHEKGQPVDRSNEGHHYLKLMKKT